jgi:LPPG:FO 2-phospho-L-lactate transferase
LAEINDRQQGWGLANESWQAMDALEKLGGDTWFRLGDRDLATHLERSQRLAKGENLAAVTTYLCERLGVAAEIIPMTNNSVRTRVKTDEGELAFQEYFVREQCRPKVNEFYFEGLGEAQPLPRLMALLESDALAAIVICPSNPFLSVEPILALPGVRAAMKNNPAPVIAVSPIVAGLAIKGPAAKMMAELNMPVTAMAVADYYGDLLDGFVIDGSDQLLQPAIAAMGLEVSCTQTIMKNLADRISLAETVLSFAKSIGFTKNTGGEH